MRLVAVALLTVLARPAAAAPLTLAEALRRVAEVGPDQAVAQAALPVAQADVRTARMLPNPALAANAGRAEPVFAAGLTLHLPILGQRGAHVRAAERALAQTRLAVGLSLWQLRHDGRIAYYAAVRADEELEIARQLEALTGRVAAIAAERYAAGAGSLLEKLQAALVHDRAAQDVVDRTTARGVARLELARLVGIDADALPPLADRLDVVGPTPGETALLAAAAREHPELRALEAERFAAEARAQAARADRRPSFDLDLGLEVLDPSTCGGGARCVGPRGGLGFDLPLFNWNGGPIARAQAEARAATIKEEAARARIATAVRAAFALWTAATARAQFYTTRYVPAAAQVEAMAREGFAAGRTGLLPLIEAQRALLEARLQQTEARFAVQSARADLEEASGVALTTP